MRLAFLTTLLLLPSPPTFLAFIFFSSFFYIHALLILLTNILEGSTNIRDQHTLTNSPIRLTN